MEIRITESHGGKYLFFVDDGWTKEKVAGLLLVPNKFDDKIKCVTETIIRPSTEVWYFSVLDVGLGVDAVFDESKLSEHKHIPLWDK